MTIYLLKRQEKHYLAAEIVDLLAVDQYGPSAPAGASPLHAAFMPLATPRKLVVKYDFDDLIKLYRISEIISDDIRIMDRMTLSHTAALNRVAAIRALHEHREWVAANPDMFQYFHHFLCVLSQAFDTGDEEQDDLIRLSVALSVAARTIEQHGYPKESHLHGTEALRNAPFVALLLANADHVDALLRYRQERGMDLTEVIEPHDAQDFADYLSQHAVKDGWL